MVARRHLIFSAADPASTRGCADGILLW